MSATEAELTSLEPTATEPTFTPEELRTWRRRAWALFAFITLSFAVGLGIAVSTHSVDPFDVFTFVFPVVGIVILAQQPRNRIGWILLGAIGGVLALSGILGSIESYGHLHRDRRRSRSLGGPRPAAP